MTGTTAVELTVLQVHDTGQMTQFYRRHFAAEQQNSADPEVTVLRFPSGGHLAFAAVPTSAPTSAVRISLTIPAVTHRDLILNHLAAEGHDTGTSTVVDPAGNTVSLVVREAVLPTGRARVQAGVTHRFPAAPRCRSLPTPAPAPAPLPAAPPATPWDRLVDWFQRTGLRVTGSALGVEKPDLRRH